MMGMSVGKWNLIQMTGRVILWGEMTRPSARRACWLARLSLDSIFSFSSSFQMSADAASTPLIPPVMWLGVGLGVGFFWLT